MASTPSRAPIDKIEVPTDLFILLMIVRSSSLTHCGGNGPTRVIESLDKFLDKSVELWKHVIIPATGLLLSNNCAALRLFAVYNERCYCTPL